MTKSEPSQLMQLFLAVAERLGADTDDQIGRLADVGPENVSNWRSGAVQSFKKQKFRSALSNIIAELDALRAQAGLVDDRHLGLSSVEVEDGASPTALQRQFRERVIYDYLGHRFLYFEPQGALAWQNLIGTGYEQDSWLAGVRECLKAWLATTPASKPGPLISALGLHRTGKPRGLDIISLGPGEGGKEMLLLQHLAGDLSRRPRWLSLALVDVSIPLLLTASKRAHTTLRDQGNRLHATVRPFCADFEEGSLTFLGPLRTNTMDPEGVRMVLLLGNVLGNVRDEDRFVRDKLLRMVRPGDLLWVEVGLRPDHIRDEPLYAMTKIGDQPESAGQASRRLLLEGPYRRWAAATGRGHSELSMRVWLREDDESCRIPGSVNFCHDLIIGSENRVCTMLYSRRYKLDDLVAFFEQRAFDVLAIRRAADSKGHNRVAHLLMRRPG